MHGGLGVEVTEGDDECSVRCTTSAGISPATMRQKRQSAGVAHRAAGPCAYRVSARPARGTRALHLGIQVLEAARGDAAVLDEGVHVVGLEPDDAPELEGGQRPLVDEPVEAAQGHAEMLGRLLGAHPPDLFAHRFSSGRRSVSHRASSCYPVHFTLRPADRAGIGPAPRGRRRAAARTTDRDASGRRAPGHSQGAGRRARAPGCDVRR